MIISLQNKNFYNFCAKNLNKRDIYDIISNNYCYFVEVFYMEHTSLFDLITCLSYGTNLHICVDFFQNYGNFKTQVPFEYKVHSKPFCRHIQSLQGLELCVKCRNAAEKKIFSEQKAFGGLCFNGVYEYCHPVFYNGDIAAIISIGNILTDPTPSHRLFLNTFEMNFDEAKCKKIASVLDNHIQLLLKEYSNIKNDFSPLLDNLKSYIDAYMYTNLSIKELSSIFGYNEKYLGKLFKKHTGETIKEYINRNRLGIAAVMLTETDLSITDISSKTGFNNVTYFNRLFKKHFTISPSEYRKNRYVS